MTVFDTFDGSARSHFLAYMRDNVPAVDPLFQALERLPGMVVTRTRRQLVADRTWYMSAGFNEYRRKANVDHQLTSMCHTAPQAAISMICVHRAVGERDYSSRERRLLQFSHTELGPLIGRSLVRATERTPDTLSPRLQQTLACLLQGLLGEDGESMTDQDIEDIRRHAETMACIVAEMYQEHSRFPE